MARCHATRIPERRPRTSVGGRGRPPHARPRHHPPVRRRRALRLDRRGRTRWRDLPRHRQRRQGLPRRRQRPGHGVLRRARTRGACARGRTRRQPVCRHVARGPGLQGRRAGRGAAVLRSRREVHLGPGARQQRPADRGHRRSQGQGLPRLGHRRGRADLHLVGGPRRLAGLRRRAAAGRRHRVARPGLPAGRRQPAVPAARHQHAGGAGAAGRRPRPDLRRGAGPARRRRGQRRRGHAGHAGTSAARRQCASVSVSITALAVADQPAAAAGAASARRVRRSAGRCHLPHRRRRHVGQDLGVVRRRALRPGRARRRRAARGHGQSRQALPAGWRSGSSDVARPRPRAAGGAARAGGGTDPGGDIEHRRAGAYRRWPRPARHLPLGCARCEDGRDLGRALVARHRAGRGAGRGVDAVRQHADAGRRVERVERSPTPAPTARPSPARRRATCSGGSCSPPRPTRRW